VTRGRSLLTAAVGSLAIASAPLPARSHPPLGTRVSPALYTMNGRMAARHASSNVVIHAPAIDPDTAARPHFTLTATPRGRPATGRVDLVPAASPFGIAVSREGRIVYDLTLVAADLPDPSTLGSFTTPGLEPVTDLGRVRPGEPLHARADWNKFTIIVSAEAGVPVNPKRWAGPVVLIGRSPSSLMQSFVTHPLYNVPEPD